MIFFRLFLLYIIILSATPSSLHLSTSATGRSRSWLVWVRIAMYGTNMRRVDLHEIRRWGQESRRWLLGADHRTMAVFITSLADAVVHSRSRGRASEGSYRDRSPPALPQLSRKASVLSSGWKPDPRGAFVGLPDRVRRTLERPRLQYWSWSTNPKGVLDTP